MTPSQYIFVQNLVSHMFHVHLFVCPLLDWLLLKLLLIKQVELLSNLKFRLFNMKFCRRSPLLICLFIVLLWFQYAKDLIDEGSSLLLIAQGAML